MQGEIHVLEKPEELEGRFCWQAEVALSLTYVSSHPHFLWSRILQGPLMWIPHLQPPFCLPQSFILTIPLILSHFSSNASDSLFLVQMRLVLAVGYLVYNNQPRSPDHSVVMSGSLLVSVPFVTQIAPGIAHTPILAYLSLYHILLFHRK